VGSSGERPPPPPRYLHRCGSHTTPPASNSLIKRRAYSAPDLRGPLFVAARPRNEPTTTAFLHWMRSPRTRVRHQGSRPPSPYTGAFLQRKRRSSLASALFLMRPPRDAAPRDSLIHGPPTRTAANRATAEERTAPFSRRPARWRWRIIDERLTGVGIVYRWAAHSPQKTGVQIQPPFASFHSDLAPLFKLPHISHRLWLAVYDYVREGAEDIVLCRGRIDCEAQDSRGCQTSAFNGHHDCLHPQSQGCIVRIVLDALTSLPRTGDFAVTPITTGVLLALPPVMAITKCRIWLRQ